MRIWIVRYWMPPKRFLTYNLCADSGEKAQRLAWDEILKPMHPDGWVPVSRPATDYFGDYRSDESVKSGIVVVPTKDDDAPKALALITEEEVQ